MDDAIRLFGMSEDVVKIGVDYTNVAIFDYILGGIAASYCTLLDISGYVVPATIYDIVAGASDCLAVWLFLEYYEDASLFSVALLCLGLTFFWYILFTSIAVCNGWLDPFWDGMLKTFAFKVSTTSIKA